MPIGRDELLVAQPRAPHAGGNRGHHLDDLAFTASGDVADRKAPVAERRVDDLPAGFPALATQPGPGPGELASLAATQRTVVEAAWSNVGLWHPRVAWSVDATTPLTRINGQATSVTRHVKAFPMGMNVQRVFHSCVTRALRIARVSVTFGEAARKKLDPYVRPAVRSRGAVRDLRALVTPSGEP